MDLLNDNIAAPDVMPNDNLVEHEDADPVTEAYLQRFTDLDTQGDRIDALLASIKKQPNDQQRLYVALDIIGELQKKLRMVDTQLVEMNNYFGAK